MSKSRLAAFVLVAMGIYSFMQGQKGTDTPSLINTWAPIATAAYVFFG